MKLKHIGPKGQKQNNNPNYSFTQLPTTLSVIFVFAVMLLQSKVFSFFVNLLIINEVAEQTGQLATKKNSALILHNYMLKMDFKITQA